jgi:DNA-binding response OmpR family regulator
MGILVIENDLAIRHPLAKYLRECGYKVFEAVDTTEAVVLVNSHRDLIKVAICDVHSPGDKNGFEFAKWLRDQAPDIQLALAATPERAAKQAAELCENGPLLSKPYDHQLLLDRIKQLMARRDRGNKME